MKLKFIVKKTMSVSQWKNLFCISHKNISFIIGYVSVYFDAALYWVQRKVALTLIKYSLGS